MNLFAQENYAAGPAAFREGAGDPPPPAHRRPPRHRPSYSNLAANLNAQGKYAAGPAAVREGAGDPPPPADRRPPRHRRAATTIVAMNLNAQGKYAQAQPLFEKALGSAAACSPTTTPTPRSSYNNLASNLNAQGKYLEARDQWLRGVKSLDAARLRVAFTGLERAGAKRDNSPRSGRCAGPARSAGRGVADAGGRPGPRPARRAGRTPGPAAQHPPSESTSAN